MKFTNDVLIENIIVLVLTVYLMIQLSIRKRKKTYSEFGCRNKYLEVDVFKMRPAIFRFSLLISLVLAILGINWTSYRTREKPLLQEFSIEEEIIPVKRIGDKKKEALKKKLPKQFDIIPVKEILQEKIEFIDHSLEEEVSEDPPKEPTKLVPPNIPEPEKEEIPELFLHVVEEAPRFPGCEREINKEEKKKCADQKLLEFLHSKIRYPELAVANGIEGRVVVSFVVEKDGSISDITIKRDIGGGCGHEAIRVVHLMNEKNMRWTPGKQRGIPVRVQYNLPVSFKLNK